MYYQDSTDSRFANRKFYYRLKTGGVKMYQIEKKLFGEYVAKLRKEKGLTKRSLHRNYTFLTKLSVNGKGMPVYRMSPY